MSECLLSCCGTAIDDGELWILQDFKNFTSRKLYIGKCKICGDDAALQIMTNTETGKTYFNLYNGIEAVKIIYREKRRKLVTFPDIKSDNLYGWIYGINVQIQNKKSSITRVRQYASDFSGNRQLRKEIKV